TFNITDGAQIRDISPILADAIYYDLHLLGNLNVDFANPATDIQHWWNEDLLNADTVSSDTAANNGSFGSGNTTLQLTSGSGASVHIGDLIANRSTSGTAGLYVLQVTAIATDVLTVGFIASYTGSGTSVAGSTTWAIIPGEQEGSDIGSDKSKSPTVRS